jgi:hypothetical protein
MVEKILCSAIHYDDGQSYTHQPINISKGIVVCGYRHHNCISVMVSLLPEFLERKKDFVVTQGFLTSMNRFVDRQEAYNIHYQTGNLLDSGIE